MEQMRGLGWQGSVTQTQPGPMRMDLSLAATPGVVGFRTQHNRADIREVVTPANTKTFGLIVPENSGNSWCHRGFDEAVLLMMPRSDFTAANSAGFVGYQLAYDEEMVARACDQHAVRYPLRDDAELIELGKEQRQFYSGLFSDLFRVEDEMAWVTLSDELLSAYVTSFGRSTGAVKTRAAARHAALAKAREYMHAHMDQAIALADVAEFACVSRRTLTHAFQESLGLGPMAYLKLLRLNRVRQKLRRLEYSAMKIIDVANEHGFWHMGQFASDYRRLFDELPSATRRSTNRLAE